MYVEVTSHSNNGVAQLRQTQRGKGGGRCTQKKNRNCGLFLIMHQSIQFSSACYSSSFPKKREKAIIASHCQAIEKPNRGRLFFHVLLLLRTTILWWLGQMMLWPVMQEASLKKRGFFMSSFLSYFSARTFLPPRLFFSRKWEYKHQNGWDGVGGVLE